MNEQLYDAMLHIKTAGEQRGFHPSLHYHRYEPTPYSALEVLFSQYSLSSRDHVVDFGCGKGRLNFYIHHLFQASVTGVEMSEVFHQEALMNLESYVRKRKRAGDKIRFVCCLAEEYEVQPQDNCFYFFNPFSVQIFRNVVHRILASAEQAPRQMDLVLYYASEDYMYFLETETAFEPWADITLPGLEHNPYERFLVYRLPV
ncbi:class I SAM-dependent methyltransferase [Ectobacillus ponti]|uniref:Class I SAM-dependent methyltransferase n=1 Tax=Ectobacillus ponti TaxID=2961894 RepID=A0AA41XA36_9BACI|nr:class I SAM-dependent methyltransferase [Ectobacillus ponti]MCP8969963.1 class I SAM-dependent methyltransferase [Ectobacillus ponti]